MMARLGTTMVLGAALVGGSISTAGVAGAEDDVTKPVLRLPAEGSFLPGAPIGAMLPVPDEGVVSTGEIPMFAEWRALDESGICGYKVRPLTFYPPDKWAELPLLTEPRFDWMDDDYIDQQGGGVFNIPGYYVRAYDCAGNHRTKYVEGSPIVWQETGESYGYGELAITYDGTWGMSTCTCWSGGTTRRTVEAGASASFEVPSGPVALVMETGPNRGAFELWIDGRLRAVVDTYAATTQHRTMVWTGQLRGTDAHTVELVNLATPGRPRIDLDAVVTS
jgi:hypothetical protein